jgi:hypothetical protein
VLQVFVIELSLVAEAFLAFMLLQNREERLNGKTNTVIMAITYIIMIVILWLFVGFVVHRAVEPGLKSLADLMIGGEDGQKNKRRLFEF